MVMLVGGRVLKVERCDILRLGMLGSVRSHSQTSSYRYALGGIATKSLAPCGQPDVVCIPLIILDNRWDGLAEDGLAKIPCVLLIRS